MNETNQDLAGTSDPVVYVDCLGQPPVNTAIVPQTLNPIFDDSFAISIRNLDSEDFEAGHVKLSVFDADSLSRNDIIGSCLLDASFIYSQPNHELWRQWVALVNEQDPTDDGVQGKQINSQPASQPGNKIL